MAICTSPKPSHPLTLSPSHPLTLSPSHPGEPIRYSDLRWKAYKRLFQRDAAAGTADGDGGAAGDGDGADVDADLDAAATAAFDVWLNARNGTFGG